MGRSGVGKTTVLEHALGLLKERPNLRVLAVKSSHHSFPDQEGSDSYRLAQAGARGVALLGAEGTHLFLDPPASLEDLLPWLAGQYDLALVEGGKWGRYPKVELVGEEPPLLAEDQVVARLPRGDSPTSLDPARRLVELLESKGQLISAAKS